MYVGIIIAGDGELEMCVGPFDTSDQARDKIKSIYDRVYEANGPGMDRWYVAGVDSVAQAEADVREMLNAGENNEG